MNIKVLKYLTLFSMLFILSSWGEKGHQKINSTSPQFFPSALNKYKGWSEVLAAHGSDPDKRRRTDPKEEIRHYIDIDAYDDFNNTHKIVEGKDEVFSKYGKDFIMKNGTLPWVTDSVYQVLVKEFRGKDWSNAVLTAADLGHYVGDGHMPLHLTINYDGQLSEQKGIHSRYESKMFGLYTDSITVSRSKLHKVKNVQRYVFDYMYTNYQYKDSLLNADKIAFEIANQEYNELYYKILWQKTKTFTDKMINDSSKSTAELIRMAWVEAGRPKMPKEISF